MPAVKRCLTVDEALQHVRAAAFVPSERRVGAEIEWLVSRRGNPAGPVPFDELRAAVASAGPLRSAVTYEPGGQLELSSPPSGTIAEACEGLDGDLRAVRGALRREGIELAGVGLDPLREDCRLLDTPRYRAMEAYFDSGGPAGRRMMCRTAAVQVNLDNGDGDDRWRLAHLLGPTLAAAFANSPFIGGRLSPWRSARLATWWAMDRTRTSPVPRGASAADAWARYVLEAHVMLIRASEDRYVPVMRRLPFDRWINDGDELGYPTLDDLDYHLTTLFPPIRPRGWLELRMIDAQNDPYWRAAIAVPAVLLYDPEASRRARNAAQEAADLWVEAFSEGLSHPELARSARECFAAVVDALPHSGADATTIDAVGEYAARYASRGRCPADDAIDACRAAGTIHGDRRADLGAEPSWT